MRFNLKKTLAGAAAIAVVATVVPFLSTSAASAGSPGSPGAGVAGINPTTGNSSTPFQVVLPPGAACPGDSASANWRLQSFIVSAAADLNASTFTFNANGSPTAFAGQVRLSLYNTFGTAFRNGLTDLAVPPSVVGQISGVPFFDFEVNAPGTFPSGAYKVGIACTLGTEAATQLVTYWSKTITIDYQPGSSATNGPGEITWAAGTAAAAAVLNTAVAGDGEITATFTPGVSDPAVPAGGFTATATPTAGGPAITATGSGSPIVIPGLVNGTEYSVTVSADNGVGSPAVSNAILATPTGSGTGSGILYDFTGADGADPAVFRGGAWFVQGTADVFLGLPGDIAVPADYDGDGLTERAVFRGGAWFIEGVADPIFWGLPGDIPVPVDFDGDGAADVAVFRGGVWFIEGVADPIFFGLPGDIPVPADYDGDGLTERAVFRGGAWFIEGVADPIFWGVPGDIPVPADFDGDGAADPAVFRGGAWFIQGQATAFVGLSSDVPVLLPYAIRSSMA